MVTDGRGGGNYREVEPRPPSEPPARSAAWGVVGRHAEYYEQDEQWLAHTALAALRRKSLRGLGGWRSSQAMSAFRWSQNWLSAVAVVVASARTTGIIGAATLKVKTPATISAAPNLLSLRITNLLPAPPPALKPILGWGMRSLRHPAFV